MSKERKHRQDIPIADMWAMIAEYRKGSSAAVAGAKFGYSKKDCLDALWYFDFDPRTPEESSQKYKINKRYFTKIVTEKQAYWLGFLAADGVIVNNMVRIDLQASDEPHLYKFKAALDSEHPVVIREVKVYGKTYLQAHFRVVCKRLANDLKALGIVQNKTFTLQPCKDVPKDLLRHYWRGVIDGDGSIWYNSNVHAWAVGLNCNRDMCEGFREFLSPYINSKAKVYPDSKGEGFHITYMGNLLVNAICQVLYKDATEYLDRKMDLATKILGA